MAPRTKDQQSPSLVDSLFNEIRSAIQDTRDKLIFEGWFGRSVTAAEVVEKSGAPFSITPARDPSAQREWVLGKQPTVGELMAERALPAEKSPVREQDRSDLER